MLDRATIDRLSRAPEKNAPMLNVALAEEGLGHVLLALARSEAVGPEALAVIGARIERDGPEVGVDPDAPEPPPSIADELDRLLVAHPRAPDAVRDAILARHGDDPFFVLAASCHPRATLLAIERAVDWPSASPVHDRLWLALIDPRAVPPLTLEEWAADLSALRREAAARLARSPELWDRAAVDPSRRVRRGVASNRHAIEARARLAQGDPAPEVRARAARSSPLAESETAGASSESARFAAALRAMQRGGALAPDVTRALTAAADLDAEGAVLAGQVLPRPELALLVESMVDLGVRSPRGIHLAAGIALRPSIAFGDEEGAHGELAEVVYDAVKALSRLATPDDRLTGKARLAAWAAEGLVEYGAPRAAEILADLGRGSLGAERMILARGAAAHPALVRELAEAAARADVVPAVLVELAWSDPAIDEARVLLLASRIAPPPKRAEDLPEDELDLDPSARSIDALERVVLAATQRTNVSPRAALAVVALDSRRVRYVLSAMPQWKGRLTGGRLARVLRQHAGALNAAAAETRARVGKVEGWTERMMSEIELSIALAVGHLTGAEVARRIAIGRQPIEDGLTLVQGIEARAANEGAAAVMPILDWASKNRGTHAAGMAIWLLLERFDRSRAPTLVASAIDALATGQGSVPGSVCDALAVIERRAPGRLETIHAQSPRGRATVASAIARAYRAVGGTREELKGG